MSDNPFDVFAADFRAAVPETEPAKDAKPEEPINIMAQPPAPAVPVMNAPVMNDTQQQQPPMYGSMYGAPPPGNPYGAPPANTYGAPPAQQQPGMGQPMPPMNASMNGAPMNGTSAPGALVPVASQPNPYASMVQPGQQPPPPGQQPMYGQPPPPAAGGMYGAPPPANPNPAAPAPYGAPPQGQTPQQPPPAMQPPAMQPPAMQPPPAQPNLGGSMMAPPASPTQASADPWGAPPPDAAAPAPVPPGTPQTSFTNLGAPPPEPTAGAIVPAANDANNDPFGIFGGDASTGPGESANPSSMVSVEGPPHPFSQEQVLNAADGGDPWTEMGFGAPPPAAEPEPAAARSTPVEEEGSRKEGELPPGGEWYDARIFTPTLGVMFFKPQELTDSLFLQTDRSLVDALDDRPVVAFIVEGSSARAAGVELGHCLLKVNGIDVRNPKEASRLIKEGPRPLPLLFYVPDTQVVVAEGEHMVKYDTRETGAPNSAKDWKPKYVVIGGIIAQPWMMNMYRSKSEYDIAVIETQARRPVSVKVKQFSLQGARIQNDWQGPQMVKYKNKLHPWKYIVVIPVSRNPIKISSPNLGQLKPVHEGIRRVLMAQQRHNGGRGGGGSPSRGGDPYARSGYDQRGSGGGYDQDARGGGGYDQGPPQRDQAAGGVSSGRRASPY